jgi:prophage endopeptidase
MRLYLIIGALIAIGLFGAYEHHAGYKERDAEMQAEIAAKNEEARAKEQELNQKLSENSTRLQEANNAINEKQTALDRAISAGRVRLPSGCVQASPSAPAASGGGDQAGSESDREVLRLIGEIITQGDRNTAQLNACVDAYNAVRDQINSQGH